MKKYISALIAIVAIGCGVAKAQDNNRLFEYPTPPEDMTNLYRRCNFMVDRFWNNCNNMKTAFSQMSKLNSAFGYWLAFMPYATGDTVFTAIDRFHDKFKNDGKHALEVARMAEQWLYSDTATYRSDELYARFVNHAATNKKIPAADRKYFVAQKKILDNSSVGKVIPNLPITLSDGSKSELYVDSTSYTVLMIYKPDCIDCSITRVRLSADMITNQLNDGGLVRIITLYAGAPDETFKKEVAAFPGNWINAASPEAEEYFDMRTVPALYYIDKNHKVLSKELTADDIITSFSKLMQ